LSHSTRRGRPKAEIAAAFAAAISAGLKTGEVAFDLLAFGISAGNQVGDIVAASGPGKKDDPTAPESKALQASFTVILAVVFDSKHRLVKYGLQFGKINPAFSEVFAPPQEIIGKLYIQNSRSSSCRLWTTTREARTEYGAASSNRRESADANRRDPDALKR
jgi:hypothetical protein